MFISRVDRNFSIEKLLTDKALYFGSQKAIIYYNVDTGERDALTYEQLLKIVKKTALYLISLGVKENDKIAMLMENTVEILIFELAAAFVGAAVIPLDLKRDTLDRKTYKLRQTNSSVLFVKLSDKQDQQEEINALKQMIPDLKVVGWKRYSDLEILLKPFSEKASSATFGNKNLEHVYIILYTSGTTSHPKGVILNARSCLLNAQGIALWQQFTSHDRFGVILPLHHINSTIFSLSLLLSGGTIILCSRYSRSKFWDIVKEFKITNTSIVPTILHDLLTDESRTTTETTLKRVCIGSAPVLPDEAVRFYQKFQVRVIQGYGQTETALRVAGVPVDLEEDKYLKLLRQNSVGKALKNNKLSIMDENNQPKKASEEGEICIKGPVVAKGYLNDPITTANSFKGEWFHSGDLGKYEIIEGEEYYFVIGRIKEIIIKGGVNISPSVVEDWLLKNFVEIDQACVVGIADERMGEEIGAAIILKQDLTEEKKEQLKKNNFRTKKEPSARGPFGLRNAYRSFLYERISQDLNWQNTEGGSQKTNQ